MTTSLKVAVVTGAGTGIGRAAALSLSRDGFKIALLGRRLDRLEETARLAAGEALAQVTDVGDPDSVKAAFAAIEAKWGRVDVLFNNAGTGAPPVPMDELPWEKWKACVDANLHGTFLCAQAAMAIMKRQKPHGGRIINNGSISAHSPRPNTPAYTSTKHAVTGLTKSIALDGRAFDIACGQIDIGNAATEMTERMANGILQPHGGMMVEPRMDVNHVAQAISYMAGLPLESNVLFMTVMATKMPFVGRG
ncbi:MAG: SDR family oxidoreductase [Betaproteobacteria bacterium]|nr:SDR family oxidoreductase [Betaproteobacteria bacterium]